MKRLSVSLAILLVVSAWYPETCPLMVEYEGKVGAKPDWPKGLSELVNSGLRVRAFAVNWNDYFFFAGDTICFNDFVMRCLALKDASVKLILHPGKAVTTQVIPGELRPVERKTEALPRLKDDVASPQMKALRALSDLYVMETTERRIPFDWQMRLLGRRVVVEDPELFAGARVVYRIVLDVWLGGNIELQKLQVPPKMEVGIGSEKGKEDADIREFLSARAGIVK